MHLKLAIFSMILVMTDYSFTQEEKTLTDKEKTSYVLGLDTAKKFKEIGLGLDQEMLILGIKDGFMGRNTLLTDDEMRRFQMILQAELGKKEEEEALKRRYAKDSITAARITYELEEEEIAKRAEESKKEGEAFLAENKKKEGVITLPSGLQYKILKNGSGATPAEVDTVQVHYRGVFINDVEFYNSIKGQSPVSLVVRRVIRGWQEALKLMRVGSRWQLFIPPELAYGSAGLGVIPPNTVVVFEIELLGIKPTEKPEK